MYKCDFCDSWFGSLTRKLLHIEKKHGKEKEEKDGKEADEARFWRDINIRVASGR